MELKDIVNASDTAKAMFKSFANRERFRRHTDIPYFVRTLEAEGIKVKQDDLLIAFKRMSDLGLGTLVYGRGKAPSRFIWNYNLKDIAKAAQGKKSLQDAERLNTKVAAIRQRMSPEQEAKPTVSADSNVITFSIPKDTVSKENILKVIELLFGT